MDPEIVEDETELRSHMLYDLRFAFIDSPGDNSPIGNPPRESSRENELDISNSFKTLRSSKKSLSDVKSRNLRTTDGVKRDERVSG